ncbi:hypothetical protein K503DRAFT_786053 [Rhizopogon vinicolor AM-OR11-026]|uniref:SMC hinge domain-containing protein n=1 Tax=Rhizopogon vinicolor AM-OR11-026 TaxID=1314800 RepID=A0A1B7MN80_9AGAM|nr:hypothetical protein K503DRAFT_786053 [Rhizopogon vinicolor AM-OR11-026]
MGKPQQIIPLRTTRASVQELRNKAGSLRQRADVARASQAPSTLQNKTLDSLTKLNALDYTVVDTVTQGQACIEFVRTQNIGRASSMVLEKLHTDKLYEHVVTPEGPRLFDLIKRKDPRSALAFYFCRRQPGLSKQYCICGFKALARCYACRVTDCEINSKLQAEAVNTRDSEQAARTMEAAQQQLRDLEGEKWKKRLSDLDKRVQDFKYLHCICPTLDHTLNDPQGASQAQR